MQALFYNLFVFGCILCNSLLLAHNLPVIDTLSISSEVAQQYVENYKDIAVNDMHKTGIPASIKLAQAMFESNFGRSDLAIKGNNHFGIKCYKSWKGGRLYYNDDKPNECFRQYEWVEDSYADHSRIITSKKRYSSLFELAPIDYKGWAKGLQKTGYATDPQYADKLIWMIEKHDLHQYDYEEDPYLNAEESPLIAASKEANQELDGPIIYAYKFGDVEKNAPDQLKSHQENSKKLLQPNASEPKDNLLQPALVSREISSKKNASIAESKKAIDSPYSSESFLKKRIVEEISTLPKLNLKIIADFNASKLPHIYIPFNKRKLPQIPLWIEKMETPTTILPSKTINSIADFNTQKLPHTFIPFNKRELPQIPLLEIEQVEAEAAVIADTPTPSSTVVETIIGNPSASSSNAAVLLSQKEITRFNKLKIVKYEEPVSLKDLAFTYDILFDELMEYNDIADSSFTFTSQMPIYLEAKNNKPSSGNQKEHTVKADETMWEIAQLYGIQLEELLERNHLDLGEEPRNGETILLRSQASYPPKIKREKPTANVNEEFRKEVLKEIRELDFGRKK